MNKTLTYFCLLIGMWLAACQPTQKRRPNKPHKVEEKIIVDCQYTFEQAVAGTKAPRSVIDQLELLPVKYYSTDGKIHAGQLLTNKKIAPALRTLFAYMLAQHFPIQQVIPIVRYQWNDKLSMEHNNSSSFCYRNVGYSKHATGMAVDINPYFNPLRWKMPYQDKPTQPHGAVYNPQRAGTFYPLHPVVLEFKKKGFRWGHSFSRKYDDHHFEK